MRGFLFFVGACLLAGPLRAQSLSANTGQLPRETPTLELGKPIEREMRGGEKHSYKVHAEAGQFVHVVALQEGIDVAVTLLDPSGKKLMIADSMNGSYGPEPVSIIAEDSGDLQVEVSASSTRPYSGHYQIKLTDLRTPTEEDRMRIDAELTYAEGYMFLSRQDVESAREAVAKWKASFSLWESLDDKYGQALSLYSAGLAFSFTDDAKQALESYKQSLSVWRVLGDRAGEAAALTRIGVTYDGLGEKQKALDSYMQALSLRRDLGDPAGEVAALISIGVVYETLGEKQQTLDYYTQAESLTRAVGDRAGEAIVLNNIGYVYADLGEKFKALDCYNQALLLMRALGNRAGEANELNNIGDVYSELGEKQKALDYFNLALPLRRAAGDGMGEATTLSNIGTVYYATGEEQKALDYFKQALPLTKAVGNRAAEATELNNLGMVYDKLGESQKSLDYYNQSLILKREVKDQAGEATTLNNIGMVYNALGEKQKALDYLQQALLLKREVKAQAAEATTLNNIGSVYYTLGQRQKALNYFKQVLPVMVAVGNRSGEATALNNMGVIYSDLGDNQKAQDCYNQSLLLSRAVQDPLSEGNTLVLLMNYWKGLRNPSLAVLFGKQAVDRFQQVRRNIGGMEKEAQQSFLKSKESYYRELAELLVSAGRLPEAQQVLDLLKIEEYSEFTQRRGGTGSGTSPVALTPMEEKSNKQYEQVTGEIAAIGAEWTQLHTKSSRSADEEKRYNELSDRLTAANRQFQAFLKTLYDSFGRGDQANAEAETINEQTAGLQTLVGELGARTVAVYTLVLDQKCVLIVITPTTRVAREIPIEKIVLRGKVFAFLGVLAGHATEENIQEKAQDLYNILIAPIEKDLQGIKDLQGALPKTLVWSLDDVLRYVPLAALYDGKQYLVERYKNVVITTASFGNLKDQPQVGSWRGVAMGVSKDYDGLGKLDAVPDELASVVRSEKMPGSHGPIPGTILLNDSFTETNMETALDQHPPLVHIASHYAFHAGDDTKSYLLLGGKETGGQGFHLTLADLGVDQKMDFKGIELLTLSGCQTAMGSNDSDGREIDGLGITAQRKGAKAVVATLWAVDDESVGLLMATFYKLWVTTPGITKVEALQQAQLALLHGTADTAVASQDSSVNDASASNVKPRPASHYSNPYYWAPFILIGNWK